MIKEVESMNANFRQASSKSDPISSPDAEPF